MLDTGRLNRITTFPALIEYLRDQLDWPIAEENFEDLTYDWDPAEFGLSTEAVGQIEIKQLRPIEREPWGIFFLSLPQKKLPITVLRRILGGLAIKKRASANAAERAAWNKDDLLFIAAHGAGEERSLAFAHFHEDTENGDLPSLKVLGWDEGDTIRRLSDTHRTLKEKLRWRERGEDDPHWRSRWNEAFRERPGESIATSKALAKELARLAREIRRRANELLLEESNKGPLRTLHKAFKEALIHDLKFDDFADMYAQTIAYGLLAARISRESGRLTADNAADMAPPTNPFLKELFQTFLSAGGRKGGMDFDELGINDVVTTLRNANMHAVLLNFDDLKPDEDPVIHFYELFVREYDPEKQVQRGVFYTPRPIVNFIVRSIDEVLQSEFGLDDGLASTASWAEVIAQRPEIQLPEGAKATDPFVRILDPATGTGTFLVEVIDLIHGRMVAKWEAAGKTAKEIDSLWNEYVPEHLLPRLYGFELMMAPYSIAHVKLGLKLTDTGYRAPAEGAPRAHVYLTNSLEAPHDYDFQLAFMSKALADEARAANRAKAEVFAVLLGNPPYASLSSNLTPDLRTVVDPYRYVDGQPIKERSMLQFEKNIQDDYVKFMRFVEERTANKAGVASMITNHSYIDGITLRGMRQSLLSNYRSLCILDLHGNATKNESRWAGIKDKNVFPTIAQGVAIFLGVPFARETKFAFGDIWGEVEDKERRLKSSTVSTLVQDAPAPRSPNYYFRPLSGPARPEWDNWKSVDAIFPLFSTGVETGFDDVMQAFDMPNLLSQLKDFDQSSTAQIIAKFELKKGHGREIAQKKPQLLNFRKAVTALQKNPFDYRPTLLHKPLLKTNADNVLRNVSLSAPALVSTRQTKEHFSAFAIGAPCGHKLTSGYDRVSVFPLWVLPKGTDDTRSPNLDKSWTDALEDATNLLLSDQDERGDLQTSFGPRDVFDWVYAVLHSPTYRSRYADYLKSDFARIPLPGSKELFRQLVALGTSLIALHLLDINAAPEIKDPQSVRFAGIGEARIEHPPEWSAAGGNRVAISSRRWFEGVPERVWNFHIGGYQPAQKWLKDRATKGGKKKIPGRVLTAEDQLHYRRMVVAMDKTIDLMAEIDQVIDNHGGWPDAFKGMTNQMAAG
jgi:hypothetical protein